MPAHPVLGPPVSHRRRTRARNLSLLTTAQTLYQCGISVDLTLTGLAGYRLAPVPALATVPFALISVGSWAVTFPASRFMRRFGRRAGFRTGSGAAVVGGLLSATALWGRSFWLFCAGVSLIGIYQAFAGYYRYTAADISEPDRKSRAISTVLGGGIVAAVAGPFMATALKDVLPVEFAASYLLVTALALVSVGVTSLLSVDETPPSSTDAGDSTDAANSGEAAVTEAIRTLGKIARQSVFLTGVTGMCTGYLVMTSAMTGAPIASSEHSHTMAEGARMIQWHMVGMYGTAFFSGRLARRFGAAPTLLGGTLVTTAGTLAAVTGTTQTHFMVALALIGVGWNLMYVSGSTLLAASYRPEERSAVQGVGEVFTLGGSALGALAAGPLLAVIGWTHTNAVYLVPLAVCAGVTAFHLRAAGPRAEQP
ncbi:MFS transporter [Streptomyces sp. NPDC001100]